MSRSRPTNHGFTLIEVLLVIAVIGIIAAVVIPSATPNTTEQLRAAARMVSTELAYARSLAVSNNSTYRVQFDTAGNRLVIDHTGSNADLDRLPDSPFRHADDPPTQQILDLDDIPRMGAPARLLTVGEYKGFIRRATEMEFGPLGEITGGGWIVLWLGCGNGDEERYIYIVVDPISGLPESSNVTDDGPPNYLLSAPAAVSPSKM